jgi:hypothetical protein
VHFNRPAGHTFITPVVHGRDGVLELTSAGQLIIRERRTGDCLQRNQRSIASGFLVERSL